MKQVFSLLVAVILLAGCMYAAAESFMPYDSLYERILEDFQLDNWRSIIDRGEDSELKSQYSDVGSYVLYAKGRLAIAEGNYSEAIACFEALPSGFPDGQDKPSAEDLRHYSIGLRYFTFGETASAMAELEQCKGILDASELLAIMKSQDKDTIISFSSASGSDYVQLYWKDTEYVANDFYIVCFWPKDVMLDSYKSIYRVPVEKSPVDNTQTVRVDGLIPSTTYTAIITPYAQSDDSGENYHISGRSIINEFTTSRPARSQATGMALSGLELYAYLFSERERYNSWSQDGVDQFLSAFRFKETRIKYVENGTFIEIANKGDLAVPFGIGGMATAEWGYILHISVKKTEGNSSGDTIRVVIRTTNGTNDNLVYYMDATVEFEKTGQGDVNVYLDDLLEEVYQNQNSWPYDTDLFLEIYRGSVELGSGVYHLVGN